MQTILGAGGAIGKELAKSLINYTKEIRLVSRDPQKVNESDQLVSADLKNYDEVLKAVEGSEICYLTAGLPYEAKTWEKFWPQVMENVIQACLASKSKLVFFDNIYLYDGAKLNPITEDLPVNPPSRKGQVRAQIAEMLWDAADEDGLQALIARSADFYGPGIKKVSYLTESVFNPLSQGKTANLIGGDQYKHSFTYTPDAGKAVALLGNTPDAYGESWHLPTAADPMTGKEWVYAIAKALDAKPKYRVAGKTMMRLMGLFIPVMNELLEMSYQNLQDYVFSSKKFESRFDFKPTSYEQGIQEIVELDYRVK